MRDFCASRSVLLVTEWTVTSLILEDLYMDINLELYKCFYYVATTLSFSEASLRGKGNLLGASEKQFPSQLFFQSLDSLAYCRLGNEQLAGGFREA